MVKIIVYDESPYWEVLDEPSKSEWALRFEELYTKLRKVK